VGDILSLLLLGARVEREWRPYPRLLSKAENQAHGLQPYYWSFLLVAAAARGVDPSLSQGLDIGKKSCECPESGKNI
jgi:hypothetical protein